MMNKTKLLSTILGGILSIFLVSISAQADIKGFEDFNGNPHTLSDYTGKGKWLVVMIWASDCRICNHEAYKYVDFNLVHSDNDATVLGISIDGESRIKDARAFIKRHSVDFPNLIAEPDYVIKEYQHLSGQSFAGTPTFLIYNPEGELKAAQAGAVPPKLIEEFMQKNSVHKTSVK